MDHSGDEQIAEIATMVFLGYFLSKLGWRLTMILGILGHAARYLVFAFMPDSPAVIVLIQVLHGICYAFFFATVYIFIDKAFPQDIRSSAQGLFNLLILGIGDLAAKWILLPIQGKYTTDGIVDYKSLFLVPAALSVVAAIILAIGFWPSKSITVDDAAPDAASH
jgi:MFS family permease